MGRRVAFLPIEAPFRDRGYQHLGDWIPAPNQRYVIRRETIDDVEGWAIYDTDHA
jgi:hypothetical protein